MNPKEQTKATLIFRCVANIELGLMAKGLLQQIAGQYFDIEAAGNFPTLEESIRPAAINGMTALNIDIANYPLDDHICKGCAFGHIDTFDYAISLSDDDFSDCVHLRDDTVRAIWKLPEGEDRRQGTAYLQARRLILDLLTGFVALYRQPKWVDTPKNEKETALIELYERLLEEQRQLTRQKGGDVPINKERREPVSSDIPSVQKLKKQHLELVPKAYVAEDIKYLDFNLTLKDIPEPRPCSYCGAPMQKEFLKYETGTKGLTICADAIPGYGCTGCSIKSFEPNIYLQLLNSSAGIARGAGATELAQNLTREYVLQQEVLKHSLESRG